MELWLYSTKYYWLFKATLYVNDVLHQLSCRRGLSAILKSVICTKLMIAKKLKNFNGSEKPTNISTNPGFSIASPMNIVDCVKSGVVI